MNKNISKILVIGIIGLGVIVSLIVNNFLVGAKGTQSEMNEIDCYSLAETSFEFQGNVIKVSEEQTCKLMKMISEMKPINENYSSKKDDPWHYYGRLRIRPKTSVWFLIFIAKKSNNYKPIFSLQRRRGSGWGVVGQFDAEPILKELSLFDKIDKNKLESNEALTPTDYSTEF